MADRPPFRADHVGSLLRPKRLVEARAKRQRGEIDAARLRAVEDDCIRETVREQEGLGLRGITDGEFRRTWWHVDVFEKIEGVVVREGDLNATFRREDGEVGFKSQSIEIDKKLRRAAPIQLDDFKFLKSVVGQTAKTCLPAPSWLFIRSGRKSVAEAAYPDLDRLGADLARVYAEEIADLAAAGCTYLQIDETHFATLCDPAIRAEFAARGRDPDALMRQGIAIINDAIAKRPAGMGVTMHACRGNFRSAWVAEGGYEPVAETMFDTLAIDGFFLEFDDARSGDFAPLRFVPKGKKVVLGLVTTKKGRLESKDELKRRIDEAAKYVPLDQLCLSPQCGFSSTEHGNEITHDDQVAKLRLVVETAREVWGEV
jgi:methionine synthase II (cobalamin-independent)